MTAFKWIMHTERMIFRLESVPIEQAPRELVSHQIIMNVLEWWKGTKTNMSVEDLAAMIVA